MTVAIAYFTSDLIKGFGGSASPFSSINEEFGTARLFLTCGGITLVCAIFCFFVLKETKGLTDKEVAVLYSRDKNDVQIERTSYLQLDNGN